MFFSADFSFIAARHRRQYPFYSLCHLKSDSFHSNLETSGSPFLFLFFIFFTSLWRVSVPHSRPSFMGICTQKFMKYWRNVNQFFSLHKSVWVFLQLFLAAPAGLTTECGSLASFFETRIRIFLKKKIQSGVRNMQQTILVQSCCCFCYVF